MSTNRPKLYIVDGHGLIYRAHFALIRNPLYTSGGMNTSAVFGFTNMLLKIIRDYQPEFLTVCFDMKGETFRHKIYDQYKAHRPKTPPEIIEQEPYIREVVAGMNIKMLEKQGFEADDILATVGLTAEERGFSVIIVSRDKDSFQLISPNIQVLAPTKGIAEMELFDKDKVYEKFGVWPDQIVDYLSLVGDSSDNVPGVPSIGPKTASKLLKEYGSLDNILASLGQIKRKKLQETFIKHRETAQMSKLLVTLDKNIPLDYDLDSFKMGNFDNQKLRTTFKKLEFRELQKQLTPPIQKKDVLYECIDSEEKFGRLLAELAHVKLLCIDVETDGLDPFSAKLVGISLSFAPLQAFYIPCGHRYETQRQMPLQTILDRLAPLLADEKIAKLGHNIKFDWEVLQNHGVNLRQVSDDTMIAAYLVKPERRRNNLDELTFEYLDEQKTPTAALIGKGAKAITMDLVPIDQVCHYACEDVDTTLRLRSLLRDQIDMMDLTSLYTDIEIPLIPVLMRMERIGVKLDLPFLQKLQDDFTKKLKELENDIYAEAGEPFNINSPKQLSSILFDKLQYPTRGIRKTSLGRSTDEGSLHKLIKPNVYFRQLPEILLEYRSLTKLLSTYVVALTNMCDVETSRIHTSYNQSVTETGRLSSSDPNLQNIPIRTELGREIRKAFIAEDDNWLILAADYSQVELRILAHMAHDESLIEAFLEGRDIHAHTASEIFKIPLENVTKDHRRMAKTINFGIDYGMTEWGLSSRLHIPVSQARQYIKNYLSRYSGVRHYIDETIQFAQKNGFVKTLFNRRRFMPDINAQKRNVRETAERRAINMPIQGTAAELIKIAMIEIDRELVNRPLKTRMLMQVHDELVFEVATEELEDVKTLVRQKMEQAVKLVVPIIVDMSWGKNWSEAH